MAATLFGDDDESADSGAIMGMPPPKKPKKQSSKSKPVEPWQPTVKEFGELVLILEGMYESVKVMLDLRLRQLDEEQQHIDKVARRLGYARELMDRHKRNMGETA